MRPLVPITIRATLSGHASLPTNITPAKLAKNPPTNDHAANVVSILCVCGMSFSAVYLAAVLSTFPSSNFPHARQNVKSVLCVPIVLR
jgi:hypothetical protein